MSKDTEDYIQRMVAEAPPLTPSQRAKIAELFAASGRPRRDPGELDELREVMGDE